MKEIQDEHLLFVAGHFEAGAFNTCKAWKNVSKRISIRHYLPGYILAASAMAAAIVLGVLVFTSDSFNRTTVPAKATAHTIILPDQTRATLAPGATLSFHKRRFAHKDRDIRQSGKVYYDVERNEAMPFEIHTSEALVRVLGTSFQVDASAVQTAIDVVNGCVFFAASSAVNEGIELTRGMHAELQAGALKPALVEAASMNPSAWATHHFIYDDAPLESVLEELSTVFGHIITCEQQNRRLSGEFSAESLEEAVSLIEATLDINLTVR